MKLLVLSGSSTRHTFVLSELASIYSDLSAVIMNVADEDPEPSNCSLSDARLFRHHFELRRSIEDASLRMPQHSEIGRSIHSLRVDKDELNSSDVHQFIQEQSADVCIVFGTDLLNKITRNFLPSLTFNVHLGLSPWFRGSATLFWPFFFLQPNWCGITLHKITGRIDGGDILSQHQPELIRGQRLHDVGVASVKVAAEALRNTLTTIEARGKVTLSPQTTSGKLFLTSDFKPFHLRTNYLEYEDKMVDSFLSGELQSPSPPLVR